MPYKFGTEKKKIPKLLDKRVKLTEEDKLKIKELYGKISQRKLAKMFGVSRRLIVFIGDEEKYKRHKEYMKNRWKLYYSKEKHRKYMKNHRKYKYELYKKDFLE